MTYRFFLFLLLVAFCTAPTFSQWSTPVPITAINDPSAEDWSPFITTDGLTLYFVRVRSPLSYYGKICAATRKDIDEPFTSPRVLDCPLNNSPGHQLCPWVSCDNLRMYYHNENGIWRIMLSERTSVDEPWPAGKSVEELNVLGNKLQAPSLTEDELTIFFNAYDIPGGKGNYDKAMTGTQALQIIEIFLKSTQNSEISLLLFLLMDLICISVLIVTVKHNYSKQAVIIQTNNLRQSRR